MTYLQMWKEAQKVCPLKGVKDWRPFGPNRICVWFHGNRRNKTVALRMVGDETFVFEPCTEEDWLAYSDLEQAAVGDVMQIDSREHREIKTLVDVYALIRRGETFGKNFKMDWHGDYRTLDWDEGPFHKKFYIQSTAYETMFVVNEETTFSSKCTGTVGGLYKGRRA